MKKLLIFWVLHTLPLASVHANSAGENAVNTVLSTLHQAASDADWHTYFSLYTEDSIYIGTDAKERWNKSTFKKYVGHSKGWTYTLRTRNITVAPDGTSAWFDEILDSAKYGTSRGTGVLIRTETGWKVAQYHLTFPLPNTLAVGITQQIQIFEQQQK